MLQFPPTTRKGIRLPKESFYNRMTLPTDIKRSFVEDIDHIVWSNTLNADTLNVNDSEEVRCIEVLTVTLKNRECNYKTFEVIEKSFPRHLLFVLRHHQDIRLLIHYKEEYENVNAKFRIIETYMTGWEPAENVQLTLSGFDLQRIYHNFVYQIAGDRLHKQPDKALSQTVEESIKVDKIKKQIARLEAKLHNENQFNIQIELSNKIKELKRQLL